MLRIKKILNNNAIIALDDDSIEYILIGKGLAFGRKVGQEVGSEAVSKKYVHTHNAESDRLLQLIQEIPVEVMMVTNQIIDYGRERLKSELTQGIEIPLMDHIFFALKRHKEGISLRTNWAWELKRLYPDEYKVAKDALKLIHDKFNVWLQEEEAGLIALHFINNQLQGNMEETMASTKLIQDILDLVKYNFKVELDEDSLSYYRFLTHLKFFSERIVQGTAIGTDESYYLFDFLRLKYEEIYRCVLKVKKLIDSEFDVSISQEEMAYLMVHLERVLSR